MDSADIVKNFLRGIQKDDSPSKVNLINLKKWEGQLKEVSHVANPESLMKCIIKFIDFVINYATSQSPQSQHSLCKDSFAVLKEIITPELKNIFVKQVTKRIFDIIIEENADSWCMKRELLKVFNHCIESSDKMVRNKTVEEFSDMYIYKMVDSISSYGDYDLQVQLIETVFRMYGQITINKRLKDLIPESQELSQSLAEINDETFDEDIRTFLNNLNKSSGKLFSIVCENIKIGDVVCLPVTNSVDGLWVDFNLWEATITWYCSTNSFLGDQSNEEDEVVWNLVTLFVSDIESVNIHCSADYSSLIIYCKLSGSCLSSGYYQDVLDKANNLSILVQNSQLANTLITEVLPRLFGKKIKQAPQKDIRRKVSTKSEYKALNIKFKRRTKSFQSHCKSDISCTTSLFDPISAKSTTTKSEESATSKNQSMDQTRRSISSRSSNIEVITIDSSAEHRNLGARLLSVIPEQDEKLPENECSKEAISINSSHTGKSSNLAEPPHIQIFSGRCSGSNINYSRASRDRVSSTPIKVSTCDRNLIESVRESNKVSQADIFETAQESLQFQTLGKVGRSNIDYSSDNDSQKTFRIESNDDYKSCVEENYSKKIIGADSNNIIETHETGKPATTSNWLAASAKFHDNSNLLSECLLKKYSFGFPEMTQDYDSTRVNISTDNRLRAHEYNNKEERRPVKVSTAVMCDIENINPLSRKMECGNQRPAEDIKRKHSQAGKMGVYGKENNISLDFEDKLILTSEAIEEIPLKKGLIDKEKILKKVSKAIDGSNKKVSTKICEEKNDERVLDELYFNSLEVNIFEDTNKTRNQNYSDEVKSPTIPRMGSKVEIINRFNDFSKEKKKVIEKEEKQKSTGNIQASKPTSASKISRNASDSEVRQSKLDEILQKHKEILTTANFQACSKDRKMNQDSSRTKTKTEIHKEEKKTIEEDEKKSTENIQAPKVSTSKVHQDMRKTKTTLEICTEKKVNEENNNKSTENIRAEIQTSPPKVSKIASNKELKLSKSDEKLQNKKKVTTCKESNAQAFSEDNKIHQDMSKTTKKEMKTSRLTSKKSEDKIEKVKNDSISIAKLDMEKHKVSPSNIGQVKVDSKHHKTAERDKGTLKRDHEPPNEMARMENNPPNEKIKSQIMNEIETRKNVAKYKSESEHVEYPKEKKGRVDIFSKTGVSTDESEKQNRNICQSSKSPDLFDNELVKKHNEASQKVLEKVMPSDVKTSARSVIIKRDVSSVNVKADKYSGSKTSIDSIENISSHQSRNRSKANLKTIVDVGATLKKQVADKIDLDKDVLEKQKFSNIKDTVSDMKSARNDQFAEQRDPNLDLNKNKVGKGEKIHRRKSIITDNDKQQAEVSKLTEELLKEKLQITTQKEKRKRHSRWLDKNPKKTQTKTTLKKGGKLQKSTPESSEDDNIALIEVRKNLLKKKITSQEFSSLKKVDENPTVSKKGIMHDLKVSKEDEVLVPEVKMKKHEKESQFDDDKLDKPEAASSKDHNDNVEINVPIEDQVNKISSTGKKVSDKSVVSEDSYSDTELIADLATPMVRIDPDKAFENLLKTSLPTSHTTVKKVGIDFGRISSSSSGEVILTKIPTQETNAELKSTQQELFHEDTKNNFEHPDSPIKTTNAVKSTDDIDTTVGLNDKIITTESRVRELKSTLKSPKYAIDPSCTENKGAIKQINEKKGTVENDSPALLEKHKKNVKFDSVTPTPAKTSAEQEITPNELKDPNQSLSTTLSGRRGRKLFNPNDLSYLNSVTDPVSSASFIDINENINISEKVKELVFLNRSSNVSVSSKKEEGVTDKFVPKESNKSIKKGVGEVIMDLSSAFAKDSIGRDNTAVLPGIVPLKKRTEMPAFGINQLKKETLSKKRRKSISKNEISYRDIKKQQNHPNKKRLKTVNLNTSIVNSSEKSHLKSFFENMLDSFRDEMGGESLLEKLNKNKTKETKPEKKSERATNILSDTGDKKQREKRKSVQKSKISSEHPKKRRETFHLTSLNPKSVKTNQIHRTIIDDDSSSPSLKLPKRFSHPVHKTPRKHAPKVSQLPEEISNLESDFALDRNNRKRLKPFEDTPSVQKKGEGNHTDEANTAKSLTKINILSDIQIKPGRDEELPSPKKIKMFEGPHLDNETIRENFSQENDLDNTDNSQSSKVSPYPILVSKHAPSWQGAALLDDKIITLKSTDYLKKYLVLFFYPIDFGTLPYVCDPMEILSFNSRIEDFRRINVNIVACSVDSFFTHNVWVRHLKQEGLLDKLEVPLLSDANHHISKSYKIYSDHLGHTFRAVFIIDPTGIVIQEIKVGLLSRIDVDIFFNWLKAIQSTV